MNAHFPRLFEPIRIGARESRNRVMRLATTTNTAENGVATARTRAGGGDAYAPRRLGNAIAEGHSVARSM